MEALTELEEASPPLVVSVLFEIGPHIARLASNSTSPMMAFHHPDIFDKGEIKHRPSPIFTLSLIVPVSCGIE